MRVSGKEPAGAVGSYEWEVDSEPQPQLLVLLPPAQNTTDAGVAATTGGAGSSLGFAPPTAPEAGESIALVIEEMPPASDEAEEVRRAYLLAVFEREFRGGYNVRFAEPADRVLRLEDWSVELVSPVLDRDDPATCVRVTVWGCWKPGALAHAQGASDVVVPRSTFRRNPEVATEAFEEALRAVMRELRSAITPHVFPPAGAIRG